MKPTFTITNRIADRLRQIDQRTLQRDLKKLVDLGVVKMKGAARAARYTLKGK